MLLAVDDRPIVLDVAEVPPYSVPRIHRHLSSLAGVEPNLQLHPIHTRVGLGQLGKDAIGVLPLQDEPIRDSRKELGVVMGTHYRCINHHQVGKVERRAVRANLHRTKHMPMVVMHGDGMAISINFDCLGIMPIVSLAGSHADEYISRIGSWV